MSSSPRTALAPAPPRSADESPIAESPSTVSSMIRRYAGTLPWYAFTVALALIVVLPVVVFYAQSFSEGARALRDLPSLPNLGTVLLTTVGLAAGSTLIAGVMAVTLASLVMRVPIRWRGIAAGIPQMTLVIPPVALNIGWIFIFAPNTGYGNTFLRSLPGLDRLSEGPLNIYSTTGIVLVTGMELVAIVFAFVFARMHEISGSLDAAARVCGASGLRAFLTVRLPLLRPSLVSALVVSFLIGLGQFTAPILLGGPSGIKVIATEVFRLREHFPVDYALAAALGMPLVIMGIVAVLVQRAVIGDQRRYVTNAAAGGMTARTSYWPLFGVVGYGILTVVLPLCAITVVAFSKYWGGDPTSIQLTTDNLTKALGDPTVRSSIANSLGAAVLAALVVLPLGFIAALATSGVVRAPRVVRHLLDMVFVSPLAVPRVMLGVAIFFVFLKPPFSLYGTLTLFIVGYGFIVLPFALRSQHASLIGLHPSLFEAARVCGAGQLRMILGVALPLTRRGMTASLSIMLILLSHDFAVSVMLRSPGTHVMGTLLYEFWETGSFPMVAAMSLLMTVVTAALLCLTLAVGGRSSLKNL